MEMEPPPPAVAQHLLVPLKLCWNSDLTREPHQRSAPQALRPPSDEFAGGSKTEKKDVQPLSAVIRGEKWSRSSRSSVQSERILHADKILFTNPTPHESFRLQRSVQPFQSFPRLPHEEVGPSGEAW